MHILGLTNIYIDHIYMFSVFIWLFECLIDAAYVQMYANICKFMLHCTSMPPPTRRVALKSVQQSQPKLISKRLIKPCNNG